MKLTRILILSLALLANSAVGMSVWIKDEKIIPQPAGPANVLNPTAAQIEKVSGAKLVEAPACAQKYWAVTATAVTEVKPAEKEAVDAAIAKQEADALAAKQAAEQAAKDAASAREAARLAERESITKAFPDEKQSEAIGLLYDRISTRPPFP